MEGTDVRVHTAPPATAPYMLHETHLVPEHVCSLAFNLGLLLDLDCLVPTYLFKPRHFPVLVISFQGPLP